MWTGKYFVLLFVIGCTGAASTGSDAFKDLASKKGIYVGTCVNSAYLNDSYYTTFTGQQFNMATAEWEMKWAHVEENQGQFTYGPADAVVAYAQKHNMRIRGHTLIWHEEVPKWAEKLNKTAFKAAMNNRIVNEMNRYKGKFYAWDVVNEVFEDSGVLRNSIFYKHFGESYIADAFHLAHKLDPTAKLYINDYSCEYNNAKYAGLYNLVKKLKAQGVPIHGVGMQAHWTGGSVPDDFEDLCKKMIDLGVELAITELDVAYRGSLATQATDYAKVFKACLKLEKCVGVTVWGWSDKYAFNANLKPDLYDSNLKPKPAVDAVKAVLKK